MNGNDNDNENEGVGIIAIIVIVVLAAVGLYYFFSSHRPPTAFNVNNNTNVPLEAPTPIDSDINEEY